MNQYHRFLLVTGFVFCVALNSAFGQANGAGERPRPIPAQIKLAATLSQPDVTLVTNTVTANFQLILSDNAVAQQEGRRLLENDARAPADPSVAYANAFAAAVNSAVGAPQVAQAKIRARLNAAVAVARAAEALKTRALEPAVLTFLNDKQYEIRLWGVRSAKFILPDLVKANASKKLTDAVTEAFKKHLTGAMAAETYESMEVANGTMVDVLLGALEFRTKLYQRGLPEDPNSEAIPFRFLVVQGSAWQILKPEQKVKIAQAFCDLLAYGAYHHDNQPMGSSQREQLFYLVQNLLSSLDVFAQRSGNQALQQAASQALSQSRIMGTSMATLVTPVIKEIMNTPAYKSLVEPKLNPPPSTNPVTAAN